MHPGPGLHLDTGGAGRLERGYARVPGTLMPGIPGCCVAPAVASIRLFSVHIFMFSVNRAGGVRDGCQSPDHSITNSSAELVSQLQSLCKAALRPGRWLRRRSSARALAARRPWQPPASSNSARSTEDAKPCWTYGNRFSKQRPRDPDIVHGL